MEWREIKQYSIYYKNMVLGFTKCKVKKIKQKYIKKTVTYAFIFELKFAVLLKKKIKTKLSTFLHGTNMNVF